MTTASGPPHHSFLRRAAICTSLDGRVLPGAACRFSVPHGRMIVWVSAVGYAASVSTPASAARAAHVEQRCESACVRAWVNPLLGSKACRVFDMHATLFGRTSKHPLLSPLHVLSVSLATSVFPGPAFAGSARRRPRVPSRPRRPAPLSLVLRSRRLWRERLAFGRAVGGGQALDAVLERLI